METIDNENLSASRMVNTGKFLRWQTLSATIGCCNLESIHLISL